MSFDPQLADPRRAEGTDDLEPAAWYVAGYDVGYRDGASLAAVRALFLGLLIGVAAALGGIALAVHRS